MNAAEALRAAMTEVIEPHDPLDGQLSKESPRRGERGTKQADLLIGLAADAELFHTPDRTGFADIYVNGHRETWPIRSRSFKQWLTRRYFEEFGGAPNSEALSSALGLIEARAHFDSPERSVHLRVGECEGRLYLDLADAQWRAVEIDAHGWRVIAEPPARFRRAAGMLALPAPRGGGSVEALRGFLNVRSDADFVLVVAWALAVLRHRGPYPVLAISGEQGTAKSTFSAILRALLDPNTAPLRALPREDRDLFIAATNAHLLTFDNVSGLPAWISDTLCRLATGGGFAVRALYTDQDEVLFEATRPVILNGIEEIVTRPDLTDRATFLTLEPIPEKQRRPEQELWTRFERERPAILGALLGAVSLGLRELPDVHLERLPRMADFARWATACEPALWSTGTFMAAYEHNRQEAVETVVEGDPVGSAVRALMMTRTEWAGTASDLLGALREVAEPTAANSKTWPGTARVLAGRLRRAATSLRQLGIVVETAREGHRRTRTITISIPENGGETPSASSAPSAGRTNTRDLKDVGTDGARTQTGARADDSAVQAAIAAPACVRGNPLKDRMEDDADHADAKIPTHSAAPTDGVVDADRWEDQIQ